MLGLVVLSATSVAADATTVLRREAGRCALAWQRSDFDGIVAYLPPRVVAGSGGKTAAARELREQFAQARAPGAERLAALPGRPAPLRKIGSWLTSLIPVTALVHGAHLELTQQTYVLGISGDGGKQWSFLLLYQTTSAELAAWFPEFASKITVPADPLPQVNFVF